MKITNQVETRVTGCIIALNFEEMVQLRAALKRLKDYKDTFGMPVSKGKFDYGQSMSNQSPNYPFLFNMHEELKRLTETPKTNDEDT